MEKVKFSLIMGTYGRADVIRGFLESLKNQTYCNFELIIIDQNQDDCIERICSDYYACLEIKYLKADKRGLSHARNMGLKHISGDIIAFPDDDCEYPPDLLCSVERFFAENPNYSILTGTQIDTATNKRVSSFLPKSCRITSQNVFRAGISFSIFIKIKTDLIQFDEQFGINSIFGSAEETDYLFRFLQTGAKGYYSTAVQVYHAKSDLNNSTLDRLYNYSMGLGAYFKKHMFWEQHWSLIVTCLRLLMIRPIGGVLFSLVKLNLQAFVKYKTIFKGRIRGFIAYDRNSYTASKKFDQ